LTRFSFIGLYSGLLDAFDEHCFEMKRSVRKKLDDSFELKKSSRPVNGMNSYSVFMNDRLVFMMDGDRASVFKPDEVEVISAPEDAEERVYLVGTWVFTGSCCLTLGLRRLLPWGALLQRGVEGSNGCKPIVPGAGI
jgi:hypothetical protein